MLYLFKVLRHYGDGDVTAVDDGAMATSVEESEETLDDGTVVKRRVVTTTQQQLTTERVRLEQDEDDVEMLSGGATEEADEEAEPEAELEAETVFDDRHSGRSHQRH